MATVKRFEELEIWKLSRKICDEIYQVSISTPLHKDYKLNNQIKSSSGSIMDNIAEGFERDGNREFNQYLSISKGSCGETRSQLYRVLDREYIEHEKFDDLLDQTLTLSKKISAFMSYLNNNDFKGRKYK